MRRAAWMVLLMGLLSTQGVVGTCGSQCQTSWTNTKTCPSGFTWTPIVGITLCTERATTTAFPGLREGTALGACSDGYQEVGGDITGWGSASLGDNARPNLSNGETCFDCGLKCDAVSACKSYECYSHNDGCMVDAALNENGGCICNLNDALNPTTLRETYQATAFCSKTG